MYFFPLYKDTTKMEAGLFKKRDMTVKLHAHKLAICLNLDS